MMMMSSKVSVQQIQEAEMHDYMGFSKSLLELKDLSAHLHNAADYCEKSFLNADYSQKKIVVENTKEYLCGAIITVVDHLGSVSSSLEHKLSQNNTVSETEFRINALNQRLVAFQQFNHKLGLIHLRWHVNFPRYNPHYIFPLSDPSKEISRENRSPIVAERPGGRQFFAETPLFLYTSNSRASRTKNSFSGISDLRSASVLPVRNGSSVTPNAPRSSFQFEDTPRLKRNLLNWRFVHGNDVFSFIRRTKRAT